MNRELKRAIRRKCREILEEELKLGTLVYLADRKGYELPGGVHFGGFDVTPEQWHEVDAYVKKIYNRAFRGGP